MNRFTEQYFKTKITEIREKMHLNEELIPANLNDLTKEMERNPNLKKLLNTKAVDLPEKYKYLVDEVYEDSSDVCLYDLIRESQRKLGKDKVFFSKNGDNLVGWAAFETDRSKKKVTEIKMFSFDLSKPNIVLLGDLHKLLKQLLSKYEEVTWAAIKENPANKIYKSAINKYSGTMDESDDRVVVYSIKSQKEVSKGDFLQMDVTGKSKQKIINELYEMELNGTIFDDDFKITSDGRDVTKLYMCKSLQGGWYRKYFSTKELQNRMN